MRNEHEVSFINFVAIKIAVFEDKIALLSQHAKFLSTKSVEGTSLAFQSIHDIHGSDSLPLCVLGVGDSITDYILKEHLEDATGLLVDEAGDPLDSSPPCQTSDGGLGDALDVVSQHLTVPLGASLSQSLASFAASSHASRFSSN